jgi:hypothetical protein
VRIRTKSERCKLIQKEYIVSVWACQDVVILWITAVIFIDDVVLSRQKNAHRLSPRTVYIQRRGETMETLEWGIKQLLLTLQESIELPAGCAGIIPWILVLALACAFIFGNLPPPSRAGAFLCCTLVPAVLLIRAGTTGTKR